MKRLFYYTDICMLLSNEEKAFEKIRRCLDVFYENRESLFVVWVFYSDMKKDLSLLNPKAADGFCAVLEDFKKQGIGEIVETDDMLSVLLTCDAYYGDANEVLYYAKKNHIPAMVADVNL